MISNMTYKSIKEKRFDRAKNRRHEAALTVIEQKYEFSKHIMNLSSPTLELCQDFSENFEKYEIFIKESPFPAGHFMLSYTNWEIEHPTKNQHLNFSIHTTMCGTPFSDLEFTWFKVSPPIWMNTEESIELHYVIYLVMQKMKEKELLERQKLKETSRQKAIEQLEYWRKFKKIQEVYDEDFSPIMPEER